MLDLKFILANKAAVAENCVNRNVKVDLDLVESLAKQKSELNVSTQGASERLNKIAEEIKMGQGDKESLVKEGKEIKLSLKGKEDELTKVGAALTEELYKIPNMTDPSAPLGKLDTDNKEIKVVGKKPEFKFEAKDHMALGEKLDWFDFEAANLTTGNKFYFLKNEAVLLEFALVRYALDILIKEGFSLRTTPDLAKLEIFEGTGYAPRGNETQIYRIEGENLALVAPAEITLGGAYKDKLFSHASELPVLLGGVSHCFRTEAGAYGKASRGLYRVHQFTKVEMFMFSAPEDSAKLLDKLLAVEEQIFSGLEIPYHVVDCCTGDLGGPAYRKYDIEAWLPGENRWGEVTSASNCTDYQSRRLGTKFKKDGGSKSELVHTLNGTAIAITRAIMALMENHQNEDGSINIPKALQPYLGMEKVSPKKV